MTHNPDVITVAQARLRPIPFEPKSFDDFRRVARWWELEAKRGHASADQSRWYGENMRRAAARRRGGLVERWSPAKDAP